MFLKIKLSENNLREKLKKSLDFVKLENMQTLNQNTETILFEATQKFMNFLVNNVLNLLNDQVKAKIHIFNNILNEKTVSLSEKSHILLEYARKIDNTLSEKENLFKNLYSSSTYFSNSDENKIIKVENDNNNSNETLTLESEKESYFSKPCTNISDKNDFNNSTMKVPIVLSDFSQENSFTEVFNNYFIHHNCNYFSRFQNFHFKVYFKMFSRLLMSFV